MLCQEIDVGVLIEEHFEKQKTGLGRAGNCIVEFVVVVVWEEKRRKYLDLDVSVGTDEMVGAETRRN